MRCHFRHADVFCFAASRRRRFSSAIFTIRLYSASFYVIFFDYFHDIFATPLNMVADADSPDFMPPRRHFLRRREVRRRRRLARGRAREACARGMMRDAARPQQRMMFHCRKDRCHAPARSAKQPSQRLCRRRKRLRCGKGTAVRIRLRDAVDVLRRGSYGRIATAVVARCLMRFSRAMPMSLTLPASHEGLSRSPAAFTSHAFNRR